MKHLFFIVLLAVLLAQSLRAQNEVVFSRQGGFYEESFSLELSCTDGLHIHYTTNGGIPTCEAPLYSEPLLLNEEYYSKSDIYTIVDCVPSVFYSVKDVKRVIVIRAAAFDEHDHCVSPVVTNT